MTEHIRAKEQLLDCLLAAEITSPDYSKVYEMVRNLLHSSPSTDGSASVIAEILTRMRSAMVNVLFEDGDDDGDEDDTRSPRSAAGSLSFWDFSS